MKTNLSQKTPEELYYLSKIANELFAYYDNQAKANEGLYNTEFKEKESRAAKIKCNYYLKCREQILAQMESIINETFS